MTMSHPTPPKFLVLVALGLAACGSPDTDTPQGRPVLHVSGSQVDFGTVPLGLSVERVVQLRNVGLGILELEAPEIEGGSPSGFSFELGATDLAPGVSTNLIVRFTAPGVGEAEVILRLASNSGAPPERLVLRGFGVDGLPIAVQNPGSFGRVIVGNSPSATVTITNIIAHDVEVQLIEGANVPLCSAITRSVFCIEPAEGQIRADGRLLVPAGGAVQFVVIFAPMVAGTRERGRFTLRACDSPACDVEVPLDGRGIEQGLQCAPFNLNFGQISPGACITKSVSCENISSQRIIVSGWSAAASTSSDFVVESSTVVELNGGDQFDVGVTYCPSGLGNDGGQLLVATDSSNTQVTLTGSGGGPVINIFPPNGCEFGFVSLVAPTRCTLVITNIGFDTLSVSSITADLGGTG